MVLKAKVRGAGVMGRDGIRPLLKRAKEPFPRLSHLWLDAGYNGEGKGKDWVQRALGWTVEVVRRPRKPHYVWAPEGEEPDWDELRARGLLPEPGFSRSFLCLKEVGGRRADVLVGRSESKDGQGL